MSRKERRLIFLLAALNFTHILDFMIMMPLSNYLMPYFSISPHQFSLLVGAYSLSAVFSGILLSSMVDKHDRKKVLLIVYTGFLLGTLACGFADSYRLLMAARLTAGFFGGIIGGQVFSIISDTFPYERRGMAVGSVMAAFAIASIVGVPVSLYLTNLFHFDWHVPFLLVGGVAFLLIPMIIILLPSLKDHINNKDDAKYRFQALIKVIQNPSQGLALIFTMLMMMGHFLIIPFINPYMEFNKGYTKDQIPMLYLVGGMASLLSAIYLGRVSDNLGKYRVFTFSVLSSLIMVVGITNMPVVPFSLVLVFFAIWFIFATGRGVTAQAMVTNVVEKEQQGSFMVLNSSMQHAGTFLASIISGYIVIETKTGRIERYEWVGYLSIVVLLACFLLARHLFRHMDKKEPQGIIASQE
jgi:MFS transporter, DHA1 family, inner membrane transport protein